MAKTIADFKKEYAEARERGDAAAMQAANDGANAIRAAQGQALEVASADIAKVAAQSSSSGNGTRDSSSPRNTYTPLDSSGNDYAGMVGMSDLHKAALEAAGNSWASAATDEERSAAHAQAEAIRALYGYSGGKDGSQYIPIEQEKADSGSFSYASAPSYTDKYAAQIEDLLSGILNRDGFSYDATADPLYQQYKDQYLREGQRAMQDTLGQVSARTGGLASSWAATAAQQANNYYASQVADKIPELYQLAYSMYLDDIDLKVQDLGLLQNMSDTAYGRYRDTMSDWRADRDFAYGVYRDDVADGRYENEWNYQVGRDQLSDLLYADETMWNRGTYTSETEYNQALLKAETLAAAGDFSGYKALGYSDAEIANLQTAYDKDQTAAKDTGSGGGGNGGGGNGGGGNGGGGNGGGNGGGGNGGGNADIYQTMYDSGITSEGAAYSWLLNKGYNTTQAGKLAVYFAEWLETNESVGADAGEGMNEARFRQMATGIASSLSQGARDPIAVVEAIDRVWDTLSASQREALQNMLGRYGYAYEEG